MKLYRTEHIKMRKYQKALSLMLYVLIFLEIPLVVEGHPGNTNSDGCHRDQNGTYHCH